MYADDIQIYSIIDPKIPLDAVCGLFNLSTCVIDIQHWMVTNKLKPNEDKTDIIIIKALGQLKFTLEKPQLFHLPNRYEFWELCLVPGCQWTIMLYN